MIAKPGNQASLVLLITGYVCICDTSISLCLQQMTMKCMTTIETCWGLYLVDPIWTSLVNYFNMYMHAVFSSLNVDSL